MAGNGRDVFAILGRWLGGDIGNPKTLMTDGEYLYSYDLIIGYRRTDKYVELLDVDEVELRPTHKRHIGQAERAARDAGYHVEYVVEIE